ncbi:hypothetical protein [Anabaena azotica]|uniref:Uncharacterized protein n=1 Tax=Anabaena azotica FACHB-119 TaxID=947527 RepID=A0ABR8D7H1_9NOST|nr:hypothetical protein [Anabaena azotica]MBD2503125.1 hypothetical protein [Anabaena azotica FACHB-119]
MNTNDRSPPAITSERVIMLVTVVTVVTQGALYLLSGGFAAGNELSQIRAELKLIRQETTAANRLQDYRLEGLEAKIKN